MEWPTQPTRRIWAGRSSLGSSSTCSILSTSGNKRSRSLPTCTARLPHLRTYEEDPCEAEARPILLGASNLWFPVALSTLAVPTGSDPLEQLVEDNWTKAKEVTSPEVLKAFKAIGQLGAFAGYDAKVWAAIQARREGSSQPSDGEALDLKGPEWRVFSRPESAELTDDFRLRRVDPPEAYSGSITDVVLVERLREVRALVGFTRVGSPGDFNDVAGFPLDRQVPVSRRAPRWVPASEVRGKASSFASIKLKSPPGATLLASESKSSSRHTVSGAE
jgi:hypothetical protein